MWWHFIDQLFWGQTANLIQPFLLVKGDIVSYKHDCADIIDYIIKKSVSCQKKDGGGHAHPSFFWYDNDFLRI